MPVRIAVENRPDLRLVVYRYFGRVEMADILRATGDASELLDENVPYSALLVFDADADLSEIDFETLEKLYRDSDEKYRLKKLGPRTGAAVLNGSTDAKVILPLYNALSRMGRGVDLSFEPFLEIDPALERLGIALADGRAVIARTA